MPSPLVLSTGVLRHEAQFLYGLPRYKQSFILFGEHVSPTEWTYRENTGNKMRIIITK